MMKKTICPASTCTCGEICAPKDCATPRINPPASVPQKLPNPPMMTASNPNSSRAGPENGSKFDRIARNTPATATVARQGVEVVVSSVVEDFMIQAQSILDEIKSGEHSTQDKVKMLVHLSDAMTKMAASAKRFAPKVSELGVAQDVMAKLLEFVRENFPQHSRMILEIIEPFGERLAEIYTT